MDSEIEPPFDAYEGDEPYLFVSYAHLDKKLVYPIIEDLYKQGVRIWYDEGIPAASDWITEIADTIINSACFLVFITPRALKSVHVRDEINLAKEEEKKMFVIYLEDTKLPSDLRLQIGRKQALFRHKMSTERFWKKLKNELAEVISAFNLGENKSEVIKTSEKDIKSVGRPYIKEQIEPQVIRGKEEKERRIIDFRGTKILQSQVDILQILENELGDEFRLVHEIGEEEWAFTVENKLVTGICLTDCSLSTVSKSIGNLHSLQRLYLDQNYLKELPETIGNLHSLQILELNDNSLAKLPKSIGTLHSLKELNLGCNELTNLPESIGELRSLQILNLEDNKLITLPDSIGTLQSLEQLDLWGNQITTLPKSIGNLQSLKELDLRRNELTGLPESIVELQSLQKVKITKELASDSKFKSLWKQLKGNGVKIRKW